MASGENVGVLLFLLLVGFGVGTPEGLMLAVGAAVSLEIHGREGQQGMLSSTIVTQFVFVVRAFEVESRAAAGEVKHEARSRTATLIMKKRIIESKWSEGSKVVFQRRLLC